MSKKVEKILNNCIKLISENGMSLEQCLKRYPKFQEELRPLLESYIAVKEFEQIKTPSILENEVKTQFINIVKVKQSQLIASRGILKRFATQLSGLWAMPALAKISIFVILFLFISGFTSILAANTLPGDFLYPVKIESEKIRIFFAPRNEKANLHIIFAKRRLGEIEKMAEEGRIKEINKALNVLETETDSAINYMEDFEVDIKNQKAFDMILENFDKQKEVLEKVKEKVPDEAKQAIQRAIENNTIKSNKIEKMKQNIIKRPNSENKPINKNEGN
jgi:hypothetical protein